MNEHMTLADMIEETVMTDTLLVTKFTNGHAVAYEKRAGMPAGDLVYTLLPFGDTNYGNYLWTRVADGEMAQYRGMDHTHHTFLEEYRQKELALPWKAMRQKGADIYEHVIAPLGIEQCFYRDWEELRQEALFIVSLPVLWPSTIVKSMLGKSSASGDAELGIFFAPFALPHLLWDVATRKESAYTMTDTSRIRTEKGNGLPALDFFLSDGDPKRFHGVSLLFSDGTTLGSYGTGSSGDRGKKQYGSARFFLDIGADVEDSVRFLIQEQDRYVQGHHAFGEALKDADHKTLLHKTGFLSADEERIFGLVP